MKFIFTIILGFFAGVLTFSQVHEVKAPNGYLSGLADTSGTFVIKPGYYIIEHGAYFIIFDPGVKHYGLVEKLTGKLLLDTIYQEIAPAAYHTEVIREVEIETGLMEDNIYTYAVKINLFAVKQNDKITFYKPSSNEFISYFDLEVKKNVNHKYFILTKYKYTYILTDADFNELVSDACYEIKAVTDTGNLFICSFKEDERHGLFNADLRRYVVPPGFYVIEPLVGNIFKLITEDAMGLYDIAKNSYLAYPVYTNIEKLCRESKAGEGTKRLGYRCARCCDDLLKVATETGSKYFSISNKIEIPCFDLEKIDTVSSYMIVKGLFTDRYFILDGDLNCQVDSGFQSVEKSHCQSLLIVGSGTPGKYRFGIYNIATGQMELAPVYDSIKYSDTQIMKLTQNGVDTFFDCREMKVTSDKK